MKQLGLSLAQACIFKRMSKSNFLWGNLLILKIGFLNRRYSIVWIQQNLSMGH